MGEHEPPGSGPGRVLARLPGGQVQAGRGLLPVEERRLAQQQVNVLRQPDQGVGLPGVARVGQPPARVLDPEPERLDRMVHVLGGEPERADLERPGGQVMKVEPGRLRVAVVRVAAGT